MSDIVPAWMWRDPGEIIEGLLSLSTRRERRPVHTPARAPGKDRYYTMARRLERRNSLKRAIRGGR